jgi:hypothetical protein
VDALTFVRETLLAADFELPEGDRERILALGPAAVGPLVQLLDGGPLDDAEWSEIHAVALLEALRAVEAVPAIIDALSRTEPVDVLHDRAMHALSSFGADALEPCLAAYAASGDDDVRASLRYVLSELGVRDERVFALLTDALRDDTESTPGCLAGYGDERAVPALSAAFDAWEPDPADDSMFTGQVAIELGAAIEELGGELSPSQCAKLDAVAAARERTLAQVRPRSRKKLGRNDRCWCGSGVKYKRCHERSDRESP